MQRLERGWSDRPILLGNSDRGDHVNRIQCVCRNLDGGNGKETKMKVVIALALTIGLAGCFGDTVKKNVECKSYAAQSLCEGDVRCMWHDKEDGTFRCKGKHEGKVE